MEDALRLLNPVAGIAGGSARVNIFVLERDVVHAREGVYVCPDPRCHALVRPAFPAKRKEGRSRSPRCYFSTHKPHKHSAECRGDLPDAGELAPGTGSAAGPIDEVGDPVAGARSLRQAVPSRFRDPAPRASAKVVSEGESVGQGSPSGSPRMRPASRIPTGSSESSVSAVRSLAEHWRLGWPEIQSAALSIPRCRGTTYGQCFEPIPAVRERLEQRLRSRAVYVGTIRLAQRYGARGIKVMLESDDVAAPEQAIWLTLSDAMTRDSATILNRLSAIPCPFTTIYVLGEFTPPKGSYPWTIYVDDPHFFWVE